MEGRKVRADANRAASAGPDRGLLADRWKGKESKARRGTDWLRKLAAILIVLTSVTIGIVGLMFLTSGTWWGVLLILVTPAGIWTATRVTPEGGTTGYLDRNV